MRSGKLLFQALIVFFVLIFDAKAGTSSDEWMLTFYTSNKLSNSKLKIELIGTNGNSGQITFKSSNLKVHVFSLGNLGGRNLGTLKSIIVEKEKSFSIYKDWTLIKAEVISFFIKTKIK